MWSLPSRSLASALVVAASLVLMDAGVSAGPRSSEPTPVGVNLLANGDFGDGMSGWQQHATPDASHIVTQITNGILEFYRVPGESGGRSNQALVFQWTWLTLGAGAPITATFELGNSSDVRKRISVLVHDGDFSDLFVCTFWLTAGAPLRSYSMRTHTTRPWSNTTISFYAATPGALGGFYELDNVSLVQEAAGSGTQTLCGDAVAPSPHSGADGPELLVNGDFSQGLAPWQAFHSTTHHVSNGVFQFIFPLPASAGDGQTIPEPQPAPVVIQRTGVQATPGTIFTAHVDLGNSSPVRKRVTVLIHQWNLDDLAACTFWLEPGLPLSTHTMRAYASETWSDVSLSVYAATQGNEEWIRVDNASLRETPGAALGGTECVEPGEEPPAPMAALSSAPAPRASVAGGFVGRRTPTATARQASQPESRQSGVSGAAAGAAPAGLAPTSGVLRYVLAPSSRPLALQVSRGLDEWETVAIADPSEDWRVVTIDTTEVGASVLYLRVIG